MRNKRLNVKEHLPLLGTLVVRHVALMMQEDDFNPDIRDKCEDESPQSPVLVKHESRIKNERMVDVDRMRSTPPLTRRLHRESKRTSSYRDIAYYAVRQKRIIPETLPTGREETSTATTAETRPVRRLSIRSIRLPKDSALRKTRSIATIEPKSTPPDGKEDVKSIDEHFTKRQHSPEFWKEKPEKENIHVRPSVPSPSAGGPAGGSLSSPRPPSLFNKESRNRRPNFSSTPGKSAQGTQGRISGRNAPISRLVQMRKQRLEKKGKQTR